MAALKKLSPIFISPVKSDEQITWTKETAKKMKQKVKRMATRRHPHAELPRILFIGETGSGKSSFISSVVSALGGDITYTAMIGSMEGREENTSKRYLEHRVFVDDESLDFILCDARGIGKTRQGGVTDREIERLIDGSLRHNDLIESERSGDGTLIDSRDPKPPSFVVFVQKAQRLGEMDRDVQNKLNKAVDLVRERGIPSCVILTHIDVVKPSLTKSLHLALRSRKIQERVQRAAKEVGVNSNRVFIVKNYTCETRTHTRHDILILRALTGILVDVYRRQQEIGNRFLTMYRRDSASEPVEEHPFREHRPTQVTQDAPAAAFVRNTSVYRHSEPELPVQRNIDEYFSYIIPRNYANEGSQSTDFEYDPDDPDSDEGLGSFESEESDPSLTGQPDEVNLQKAVNKLHRHKFPESYTENANLRGPKPLFQPIILQLDNSNVTTYADKKISLQLRKSFMGEGPFHEIVYETLEKWCTSTTGSMWMSYTLPADLSLPVERLPPPSTELQVLFFAPEHPPLLLTVFDEGKIQQNVHEAHQEDWEQVLEEEVDQVRLYTLQTVKLLTVALLDYCCCDFFLLPCCISLREFSLENMDKEVKQQLALSRQLYAGPNTLSGSTYSELKEAAIAVSSVTHVPRFMLVPPAHQQRGDEGQESDDLVLYSMDQDWHGVVSLLVEIMTTANRINLTYPSEAGLKTHVAVLEAAKRLSFVDQVTLVTPDERVLNCSRRLIDKIFEETGVSLKLMAWKPGTRGEPEDSCYVVLLDCPPSFQWKDPDCMVVRVSKSAPLEASSIGHATNSTDQRHSREAWLGYRHEQVEGSKLNGS